MLVKFDSDAGQFFMDGDIAIQLLKLMGQSGVLPGALMAADVGAALARLEQALRSIPAAPTDKGADDEPGAAPVTLRQRAFPLVELLGRAAGRNCDVLWARL